MLFDFLWNGKKDKIKRKTLCQAFEQGGLKMVNIHEYLSAMKINWLRRIFQPDNYCLVKNVCCCCFFVVVVLFCFCFVFVLFCCLSSVC